MPNSWLLEKNFNGGLQETHYFDGRLLSADAFKADQDAVQTRLDWLGRATGYGIIDGLIIRKVQTSETQLSISRGLGLSYSGRVIRLPGDMTLSLTKSTPAPVSTAASAQQKTGTFTSVSLVQQQQATTNCTRLWQQVGGRRCPVQGDPAGYFRSERALCKCAGYPA